MAQGSGFDMSKVSTATKILIIAAVVYLIDTFLPWQRVCVDLGPLAGGGVCGSASGASGIGIINVLLAIALIVWEALEFTGVTISAPKAVISAALAGGIVVFTLIKILVDHQSIYLFAFVGIVLALVIGYGGWMRWQEANIASPPQTPGGGGGGFTS